MIKKLLIFLCLLPGIISAQCSGNISFTVSVPPGQNNTYPPGTTVELCVTMDGWLGNSQGSNWFEGFGLDLGEGWETITPITAPNDANSDGGGTWIWVESVTSESTLLTAGPGYFFEGPTGPMDGNPGNDWGDSCPSEDCVWTFCVELTAQNGNSGADLHIGVTAYSDGTMGSWGTQMCNETSTDLFDGSIGCLVPGCTDQNSCNFNPNADCDNGSCILPGCMDPLACNFDPNTTCDDGSCIPAGCIDPLACNFNPLAGCDNGTCGYFSADEILSSSGLCPDTICTGLDISYTISGNPLSTFEWSISGGGTLNTNGSSSITVNWGNIPGEYTVSTREITQEGCVGELITCSSIILAPNIDFTTNTSVCYNQSLALSANPSGGSWSGTNVNGSLFYGYETGINLISYNIDFYGCDYEENLMVLVWEPFTGPEIIYDKPIIDLCLDSKEQTYRALDDRSLSYTWLVDDVIQTSGNSITINWYDTTNVYSIGVYGIDQSGCISKTSLINIKTEACQAFFAPNSFTPNSDGTNDIFRITGVSIYDPTLKIWDRWGNLVYQSSNLYWTGDNGTGYYCDTEVYNWEVEYKDKFGFKKYAKGFVSLIR